MWVRTGVGALQNERTSSSLLFSRGAAQRRADCFVSTATAPHASPYLARHGSRQCRQPPPILSPCAHSSSPAARRSRAREHTRTLRARVRHFSFFAFTASPLCRKPLFYSRFGVKAFPEMLHRGESSIPPPSFGLQSAAQSPIHPLTVGDENHEKPPAKYRKTGDAAPKPPSAVVKAWVKGISAKPSPLTA